MNTELLRTAAQKYACAAIWCKGNTVCIDANEYLRIRREGESLRFGTINSEKPSLIKHKPYNSINSQ
ncbi:MAG: hypothetical protein IAE79_13950 [Anaerolinea sp.]|nr:hypothetical protein [Anaerolinea sp.]